MSETNEVTTFTPEILISQDGVQATTLPQTAEDKAKQLPDPVRFQILTVLPEIDEEYESGIVKSSQSIHYEEVLSPVLFVVKLGPDAFKDASRFPSGPSCKVGDFVIVRPNSGTRLKIHGKEFRLITDDLVEADRKSVV